MATRFDYRNVAGQCKKENRFEGGKPYEFGLEIDKRFGKGTAEKLFKLSKTIKQWEIGELELVILLVFLSHDLLSPPMRKQVFSARILSWPVVALEIWFFAHLNL